MYSARISRIDIFMTELVEDVVLLLVTNVKVGMCSKKTWRQYELVKKRVDTTRNVRQIAAHWRSKTRRKKDIGMHIRRCMPIRRDAGLLGDEDERLLVGPVDHRIPPQRDESERQLMRAQTRGNVIEQWARRYGEDIVYGYNVVLDREDDLVVRPLMCEILVNGDVVSSFRTCSIGNVARVDLPYGGLAVYMSTLSRLEIRLREHDNCDRDSVDIKTCSVMCTYVAPDFSCSMSYGPLIDIFDHRLMKIEPRYAIPDDDW